MSRHGPFAPKVEVGVINRSNAFYRFSKAGSTQMDESLTARKCLNKSVCLTPDSYRGRGEPEPGLREHRHRHRRRDVAIALLARPAHDRAAAPREQAHEPLVMPRVDDARVVRRVPVDRHCLHG